MMKLSYRDKIIALVLTVVLILVGGAIFIVKPQIEKFNAIKLTLAAKEQEKTTVETKIATFDTIQAAILSSLNDIEANQEPFYTEQRVFEMEQLFHSYCDEAAMNINSITLSLSAKNLEADQYTPENDIIVYPLKMNADLYNTLPQEVRDIADNVAAPERAAVEVGAMDISVTFSGITYWDDMQSFIDIISGLNRTIIINSLSLGTAATEESSGTVNCQLTIYNIVPMDVTAVIDNERSIAQENGTVGSFDEMVAEIINPAETVAEPEPENVTE
jgi:Tfp pilus assembly protein PilO